MYLAHERYYWHTVGYAVGIQLHSCSPLPPGSKQKPRTTLLCVPRLCPPGHGQHAARGAYMPSPLTPHLQRPALSEAMGPSHFLLRARQKSQLFRSGCCCAIIIVEGIVAVGPARSDGIATVSWSGFWPVSPSWATWAEGAESLGINPSSGIKFLCCSSIVLSRLVLYAT